MLALKKKRAKEAAEAAEAAKEASENKAEGSTNDKVSLLGIGGKKKKDKTSEGKNGGKKRTPGEIRIQKGA